MGESQPTGKYPGRLAARAVAPIRTDWTSSPSLTRSTICCRSSRLPYATKMPSVFTRIINKELPGVFVYEDDICVAFLSIGPLTAGHVLVVPREEIADWIELDRATMQHLTAIAQDIGIALQSVYRPEKVGLMIAGLEVPHVHLHVIPINGVNDMDFANAGTATAEELEAEAIKIRAALAP